MVKINMADYEAAKPMGDAVIVPGCYVARITDVKTSGWSKSEKRQVDFVAEKEYVQVLFDIAEGEYRGAFSGQAWDDEDKDRRHCFYMSWKNLGALKSCMLALEESNPGFDPMAAFIADRWDMFRGRLVGLRWGDEEVRGNDGEVKTYMALPNLCSAEEVRSGKAKTPSTKKLKGGSTKSAAPKASYDADIPF